MPEDAKCIRCGWPIVSSEAEGCTTRRCACLCDKYPACGCGVFDKENPSVAIAVPMGTNLPPKPSQDKPTAAAQTPGPMAPPTTEPTFVLMNYPPDSKGDIVFIGRDKGKAFDALMEYGKDKPCQVSDLKMVREAD